MKKLFTLVLSTALAGVVNAQTVSPSAAAQKAASVFAQNAKSSAAKGTVAAQPQLANVTALNGDTCFYVFNNPQGGYVIIGGDAASKEVLAVVDNGSFDYNSLPEQAKGMLNHYAQQISAAKKAGLSAPVVTAAGSETISALCPANWGQDAPYSNYIPLLPDLNYFRAYKASEDDDPENFVGTHAATGCVATAAAQALYTVYKLGQQVPANITEDISKKLNFCDEKDNVLAQTETLTYSASREIKWNILKDKYEAGENDESAVEVGQLMYLMGLVSDMGYGISSGALTTNLQDGLSKYLEMDAKYLAKYDEDGYSAVSDSEWEKTIYDELVASRPVVMTGTASDGNGGHCFVCDGYEPNGNLFHINWGWDGSGDGNFALSAASVTNKGHGEGSALKPETKNPQTGGSSTYDFGYCNEIVYNLVYTGKNPAPTAVYAVKASENANTATYKVATKNGIVIVKNGKKFNAIGQQM